MKASDVTLFSETTEIGKKHDVDIAFFVGLWSL